MLERLRSVVAAGTAVEIGVGEKKLGAVQLQLAQVALVFAHQLNLAYRGTGLEAGRRLRALQKA